MELRKIKPFMITVPKPRITSSWDDETFEMFKDSVSCEGVQEPIYVLEDKKKLWLIDGFHRLQESKLHGWETIDCVVTKGTLDEVYTKNLMTTKLQGKSKVTEEIAVVKELNSKYKYSIDKIVKKTGYKRTRVEDLLNLAGCRPEVMDALDDNSIHLCHAREISRLVDSSRQLVMLDQIKAFKPTCRETKAIIDDALEMLAEIENDHSENQSVPPPRMPVATCHFCDIEADPRRMFVAPMCPSCYGFMTSQLTELKAKVAVEQEKIRNAASTILEANKEEGKCT